MLKVLKQPLTVGQTFQIRNSWRELVAKNLKTDEENYPFYFSITDVKTEMKSTFYIAQSIPDTENEEIFKIKISETAIKYLLGQEVPDSDVGLYFSDYLPLENSKLLILDSKNQMLVHPVIFKFTVSINKMKMPVLDMILENILTDETSVIAAQINNSWKLLHGQDTYMSDVEKMYQDTFIHKEFVYNVCTKFANHLRQIGEEKEANELMVRAKIHDNSKIMNKDEFRALTGIINDKSCLKDASAQLSQFRQDSIELHWKHNTHHPEHFTDVNEMTKIDRIEMCCDWYARAIQYNTNLLEFVEKRQVDRFHFPELFYEEIYHYCKILISL